MAEYTKIEWAGGTFNTHWGCAEVSPGCDHCYARELAHRFGVEWGVDTARRAFGDKHWDEPLKWNAKAAKAGKRITVFSNSMSDLADKNVPDGVQARWFALTKATPWIDWLALTKRIGNFAKILPADWGDGYPNVFLGSSICNQKEADDNIPRLLRVPAVRRFLSMEPLLGPVNISSIPRSGSTGLIRPLDGRFNRIDWVIVGGESGRAKDIRPMHPDWVRSLRDQCAAADVPFLFKQWGEWWEVDSDSRDEETGDHHQVDVRTPEAREMWDPKTDCLLTADGRRFTPETLPEDTPGRLMTRIGKIAAGRLLDGVEHNGLPHA